MYPAREERRTAVSTVDTTAGVSWTASGTVMAGRTYRCKDTCCKAGGHGSLQDRDGKFIVMRQIQLEEADGLIVVGPFNLHCVLGLSAFIVRCGNVLDRTRSRRAQAIGKP
jgi:hypothetical protein